MIKQGASVRVERVRLEQLLISEYGYCFPEKFATYLLLLTEHPDEDVDPLIVTPSGRYPGLYTVWNGRHRFCASIIAGREDVLCLVVEEGKAS